jgi:inner membrane protein
MDPLTHTLTGLALSRAGLKRFGVYATPVLLLAANAPDIDIVAAFGGTASYLHYHRHITHAFLMVPLLAALPLLVVRLFARKPFDWKSMYLVSCLGVLSHPLLDWTNVYGVRFLLPFSSHWYRLDIMSLPDFWILGALLVAACAPWFSRLVSSEIGARSGTGRGWAIATLCFMVLFGFGRYLMHERAVAVLDSRLYDNAVPLRVAALPGPMNPFRWRGLVQTDTFYSVNDVNLLSEFDPTAGSILYFPELGPREKAAAAAARRTEAFQVFLDFSQFPFWRFMAAGSPENAIRVEAMDLRFGSPSHPHFVAHAVVDSAGRVLESGFSFR